MPEPGSEPLKNRHEAFAQRVAGGERLGSAWASSARDVGATAPTAAAANVGGSRAASDPAIADRIAYLKRVIVLADAGEPITRESIYALMEECTGALVQAAEQASRAGHVGIATQIKRVIVTHAGRQLRLARYVEPARVSGPKIDGQVLLDRLGCRCHV